MLHHPKKSVESHTSLEAYFSRFRKHIIGRKFEVDTPYGRQAITYADWTASGRMYQPIEDIFQNAIYPYVANTHTETNITGCSMTHAYNEARSIIKEHVNADRSDILISSNSGMTGVVNKFQRILGLKIHEKYRDLLSLPREDKPVIFVTHMEHHSNHTSWLETVADVVVIGQCPKGLVCLDTFDSLLRRYADRKYKYAAVTSCSNVTGISTPYHEIAKRMHHAGGYCFVDFACSAPYIDIDMHPDDESYLDAIYFSPHKFLGGPSSAGVLIFNEKLYGNKVPDNPGGGTVDWTNPWGQHKYHDAVEAREDGGTPAFLQTIRTALCIKLKEEMDTQKIAAREHEMNQQVFELLSNIENVHILADHIQDRLSVFSFYIDGLHYNLGVKLLNDKYGIQVRGGCSCAGTYGHYLLGVNDQAASNRITCKIDSGDLSDKPGWIRMSLHPTMTDEEVHYLCNSIIELSQTFESLGQDYLYNSQNNEWQNKINPTNEEEIIRPWFDLEH